MLANGPISKFPAQSMRRPLACAMALSLLASVGCGYFKAGQWDEDPRNWNRAFGQPIPAGWVVLHSRYWRNPHFTYEGGYYFAVRVSAQQCGRLIKQPDLIKYEPYQSTRMNGPCAEQPKWFAPKQPISYEAWRSDAGTGNYRLLIDKENREVFFSDCQF